jgi:lipoyl-dependent peroxiredoxin
MKRKATAVWKGTGKEGNGTLTTTSGALKTTPYSTAARFESEDGKAGTNPEELIAAAHAGCYSMALSFQLTGAGFPPEELHTDAVLSMSKEGVHWSIDSIALELRAKVPKISADEFQKLANAAKEGCPVSRALNVDITLKATLA